jgi:pimeloyl-ACP methyl ester carboxylesterase
LDRVVLLAPAAEPTHFARILATALGFSGSGSDGVLKRIEQRLGKRLQDMNVVKFIPSTRPPLLVFHDLEDPEVPFDHGEAIARAWPGARLEPLAGMGHRRMLRDAGVIDAVTEFIADQTELKFPPVPYRA